MPRKAKSPVMKFVLQVSERDRRIYEQCVVENQTQRQVAALYGISQSRVARIIERVFRWLSDTAPYGLAEVPRPQRLYSVARTHKMKLAYYERRALAAFDESERKETTIQTFELIPREDGEGYTRGKGKLTVKSAKPDIKYLNAAASYAEKLVEFEGFAPNGAVARNNNDRLHEVPEILKEEEAEAMIQVGEKLKRRRDAERAAAGESSTSSTPSPTHPVISSTPPLGSSSKDIAETHSAREIAQPNDFDAWSSNGANAVDCSANEGIVPEAARIKLRTPIDACFQGLESGYYESDCDPELVLGKNEYLYRGEIRTFPPSPPGFVRGGFRCVPGLSMKFSDPEEKLKRKPFLSVRPPQEYILDERNNEWVPNG